MIQTRTTPEAMAKAQKFPATALAFAAIFENLSSSDSIGRYLLDPVKRKLKGYSQYAPFDILRNLSNKIPEHGQKRNMGLAPAVLILSEFFPKPN